MGESALEMAERHVAQAKRIILDQRDRIAILEQRGQETAMARTLLETYETTLRVAQADLDFFRDEIGHSPQSE